MGVKALLQLIKDGSRVGIEHYSCVLGFAAERDDPRLPQGTEEFRVATEIEEQDLVVPCRDERSRLVIDRDGHLCKIFDNPKVDVLITDAERPILEERDG